MVKKFLSLLLALTMVLSIASVSTFAEGEGTEAVAKIGEKTFTSLKSAVDSATDGDTIVLLTDTSLSEQVRISNKKITLNLNGKAISANESIVESNESKYKDKNNRFTTGLIGICHGSYVTITDTAGNGCIDGSTIAYCAIAITAPGDNTDDSNQAVLVINGGTFKGYNFGISGNGSDKRGNTKITINDGKIIAICTDTNDDSIGIYNPQEKSELIVNGGEIEGNNSGIEIRSGSLEIKGGKITARTNSFKTRTNGNGGTVSGAAVAVSQHTTNHDISVTIIDGILNGIYALYENDMQDPIVGKTEMSVSGGTFNGKVSSTDCTEFISGGVFSEAIPESLISTETALYKNSDGKYSVDETIKITVNSGTNCTLATVTDSLGNILTTDTDGKYTVSNNESITAKYVANYGYKFKTSNVVTEKMISGTNIIIEAPETERIYVYISDTKLAEGIKSVTVTDTEDGNKVLTPTNGRYKVPYGDSVKAEYTLKDGYVLKSGSNLVQSFTDLESNSKLVLPETERIKYRLVINLDTNNISPIEAKGVISRSDAVGKITYTVGHGDNVSIKFKAKAGYVFSGTNLDTYVFSENNFINDETVTLTSLVHKYSLLEILDPKYTNVTYKIYDDTTNKRITDYTVEGKYRYYKVPLNHSVEITFVADSGYEFRKSSDDTQYINHMDEDEYVIVPSPRKLSSATITIPSGTEGLLIKVYNDSNNKKEVAANSTTAVGVRTYTVPIGDDIRVVITTADGYKFKDSKSKNITIVYNDIDENKTVSLPKVEKTKDGEEEDNPNTGIEDNITALSIITVSTLFSACMVTSMIYRRKKKEF